MACMAGNVTPWGWIFLMKYKAASKSDRKDQKIKVADLALWTRCVAYTDNMVKDERL